MTPPAGRPPRARVPANRKVTVRFTDAELARIEHAAKEQDISDWLRATALSRAEPPQGPHREAEHPEVDSVSGALEIVIGQIDVLGVNAPDAAKVKIEPLKRGLRDLFALMLSYSESLQAQIDALQLENRLLRLPSKSGE